ncbi:MAG: O-antigen ligase family protein, partial [Rubripirellula sp.]
MRAILDSPFSLTVWLCLACLVVGVVLSLSRGGWAATIVASTLVVLLWKRKDSRRRLGPVMGVGLAMAVAFFVLQFLGFGDRVGTRMDDLELNNVLTDSRFDHWSDALPAVVHFLPFGSGLGTYGDAYLAFDPEPTRSWFAHAHNQYLETAMEMGVFGILAIVLGLFFSVRLCVNLCSSDRSRSKQSLGLAVFLAVVLHAFHAVTDFGLMMPGNLIALATLLGAAAAASQPTSSSTPRSARFSSTVRVANPVTGEQDSKGWLSSSAPLMLTSTMILAALCGALWQQGRHVSAVKLVESTDFQAATPSPTVSVCDKRTHAISEALNRWPQYEPLLRQKIRLRIHRSRRKTYDDFRTQSVAYGDDPVLLWGATAMESAIASLFDDSANAPSDSIKSSIRQGLAADDQLQRAWLESHASLSLNPVQPRTHNLMALLAASTGRDWQQPFSKSKQLSVASVSQTFS